MPIIAVLTLLLIATPPINSANSSLQKEVSISNMATVHYDDFRSAIYWEDGFEDGDANFPSWDTWYSDTGSSTTTVATDQVRGGEKSVKFTMASGTKTDKERRLGLFIHDDTGSVYETGFYFSFWMYIPSNIEDMVEHTEGYWINIGGVKWYFNNFTWHYGARWALYWSTGSQAVRALIRIKGHAKGDPTPPAITTYQGTTYSYDYTAPTSAIWYHDINYGAWNHFQVYCKSVTDNTGEWKAWVNGDLLGTISGEPTHPYAYLTPDPPASFFSQNNIYPHPQLMYYTEQTAPGGTLYADDAVIATEKVPENYLVVKS